MEFDPNRDLHNLMEDNGIDPSNPPSGSMSGAIVYFPGINYPVQIGNRTLRNLPNYTGDTYHMVEDMDDLEDELQVLKLCLNSQDHFKVLVTSSEIEGFREAEAYFASEEMLDDKHDCEQAFVLEFNMEEFHNES